MLFWYFLTTLVGSRSRRDYFINGCIFPSWKLCGFQEILCQWRNKELVQVKRRILDFPSYGRKINHLTFTLDISQSLLSSMLDSHSATPVASLWIVVIQKYTPPFLLPFLPVHTHTHKYTHQIPVTFYDVMKTVGLTLRNQLHSTPGCFLFQPFEKPGELSTPQKRTWITLPLCILTTLTVHFTTGSIYIQKRGKEKAQDLEIIPKTEFLWTQVNSDCEHKSSCEILIWFLSI